MALRFLADHCVSNSTIQTIREANHEVLRLRDVLPVESSESYPHTGMRARVAFSTVLGHETSTFAKAEVSNLGAIRVQ